MPGLHDQDILAFTACEEENALRQLHYWLRYEGMAPLLGGSAFFIPYGIVMVVLVALAVVFTPYMLFQLWRARWLKSILAFALIVLVPVVGCRFVSADDTLVRFFLTYGPLVPFFIYTWGLRLVLGEKLAEVTAVRHLDYERERNAG